MVKDGTVLNQWAVNFSAEESEHEPFEPDDLSVLLEHEKTVFPGIIVYNREILPVLLGGHRNFIAADAELCIPDKIETVLPEAAVHPHCPVPRIGNQ